MKQYNRAVHKARVEENPKKPEWENTFPEKNSMYLHFLHILGSVLAEVEMPEQPMPHRGHPPERSHGSFHCKFGEALGSVIHIRSEWLPGRVDYQSAKTTGNTFRTKCLKPEVPKWQEVAASITTEIELDHLGSFKVKKT